MNLSSSSCVLSDYSYSYSAIMSDMDDKFSKWLVAEIENRGWTQAELARRSGTSRTSISDLISGKHPAGFDLCVGISQAFKITPESVLRMAGLLPEGNPNHEKETMLLSIFNHLPEEQKTTLVDYASWLLSKNEKK